MNQEKKAIIFDIRRFSVHDGDGIRTNIFLRAVRCVASGVRIRKDLRQKSDRFILKIDALAVGSVQRPR